MFQHNFVTELERKLYALHKCFVKTTIVVLSLRYFFNRILYWKTLDTCLIGGKGTVFFRNSIYDGGRAVFSSEFASFNNVCFNHLTQKGTFSSFQIKLLSSKCSCFRSSNFKNEFYKFHVTLTVFSCKILSKSCFISSTFVGTEFPKNLM